MSILLPALLRRHDRPSVVDRADPRLRVVLAAALAVVLAAANRPAVLALGLAAGILGVLLARLSPMAVARRLVPLNVILLLAAAVLPLTTPGTPLAHLGPLDASREGAQLGAVILLKGNAAVLTLVVLLGSLDATVLGHALHHLHVPDKLAHLLLMTVRYLDVLHREYLRLRAAMRVRAFRPRMDRHTYRTYGYLIGMLLVRSFDRSERIVAAMRCRGFRGHFYLLDHFVSSGADLWFATGGAALLTALILLEWA